MYFRLFGCVNHVFVTVNFLDWQNSISFSPSDSDSDIYFATT